MNILITGGLGHIGTYVIPRLKKIKNIKKIYIIDNCSNEKYSLLQCLKNKKISFIYGDLTNYNTLNKIPNVDIIIHLASITNAEKSFDNPRQIKFNNLKCFENIIEFCKKKKSKLIHISSTSVYGKQNGIVDETLKKLKPQSPYAAIKLQEENILKKSNKLKYITIRFGTICGVSPGMRFHTAINKFCLNTVLKLPIPIWGKVANLHRPYLSLKDAFNLISYIIKKDFFPCDIYNMLTKNMTINEILKIIRSYGFMPKIKIVKSKLLNQNNYNISNKKISKHGLKVTGKINKDIFDTLKFLKTRVI